MNTAPIEDNMTTRLEAKVQAVNTAHRFARELNALLKNHFQQFVGKKIVTANGEFTQKVKSTHPTLPTLPTDSPLRAYRHNSPYSLAYTIVASVSLPGNPLTAYYEVTTYIGRLEDGVLASIEPPLNPTAYRHNYTVEEVKALQEAYNEAQKAVAEAQHNLGPFSHYD